MFGGEPQHLHVGVGQGPAAVPPRLDRGRDIARRVPAGGRLPLPLLRQPQRQPDRRLDPQRTPAVDGPRRPLRGRLPGGQPARSRLGLRDVPQHGAVRQGLCVRPETARSLVVAAGRGHIPRWTQTPGSHRDVAAHRRSPGLRRDYDGVVYSPARSRRAARSGSSTPAEPSRERSPTTAARVFFGAYDGYLYSLRASNGKLIWRRRRTATGSAGTARSTRLRPLPTPASISARPTVTSTRSASGAGSCAGRTRPAAYVYGSPAVWRGRVFVGSYDHTFYALNAATGAVLWKFHANGPISGSATVVDGIVYFATL